MQAPGRGSPAFRRGRVWGASGRTHASGAPRRVAGVDMGRMKVSTPVGDVRLDGVTSSYAWADLRVSFSIPDARADYGSGYIDPVISKFSAISATQATTARWILERGGGFSVEGFTGLRVTEGARGSGAGEIRLGNAGGVSTAYGYMPGDHPLSGDVWFGLAGRRPVAGNYDHLIMLHELGHTLGLKHPHERDGRFGALPTGWDSMEYTVMTYRPWIGAAANGLRAEKGGYAQSFMMLDIAALQRLYGADFTTNAGDTVYRCTPSGGQTYVDGKAAITPGENRIFLTVWDGGGRDTYDLSAYRTDVRIDLTPGGHSVLSKSQLADLGGGPNGGDARGNVFNALQYRGDPRSLIENAVGGAGDDVLIGNAAANRLLGGAGDDRLLGGAGNDVLYGGAGFDRLWGGAGNDTLHGGTLGGVLSGEAGNDRLYGGAGADQLLGGTGVDLLRGRAGADRLVGGTGADTLIGGTGADTFRFLSCADSAPGAADHILAGDGAAAFEGVGRAAGDRIDLSAIDADALTRGDQAFVFGTKTDKGCLWVVEIGGDTWVRGNVDNDRAPEFELVIEDGGVRASSYTAHDFIL